MNPCAPEHLDKPTSPFSGRTFHYLEGMRGIAAILVVLRHIPLFFAIDFPLSGMAVDFFFLVSGAVICHSYEEKLRGAALTPLRFIGLRLIRLFPLYFVFTVVGFAGYALATPAHGDDIIALLTSLAMFIPNFANADGIYPFDGPAWSIFFELVMCCVYGVLLYDKSNKVLALIAILALSVFVVQGCEAAHGFVLSEVYDKFSLGPARVGFSFTSGVLIYRWTRSWATRRAARGRPPLSPIWGLGAVIVATAMLTLPVHGVAAFDIALFTALTAVFPAALFLGLASREIAPRQRLLKTLGDISYPIYISHVPLYKLSEALLRMFGLDAARSGVGGAVLCLCALVLVAGAANRWFDVPVRARLRRAFSGATSANLAQTPMTALQSS